MTGTLFENATAALKMTLDDPDRRRRFERSSEMVGLLGLLIDLVDDEVLYTTADVEADFRAALWNLACGFYKSSASCMRNGLDVGVAGLHFLISSNLGDGSFLLWNEGKLDTPNWPTMKKTINAVPFVIEFNRLHKVDLFKLVHEHFKSLCSFTHSRPYTPKGDPSNSTSMDGGSSPNFSENDFDAMLMMAHNTMRCLGTIWLAAYPNIIARDKFRGNGQEYGVLLDDPLSQAAYAFAAARAVDA